MAPPNNLPPPSVFDAAAPNSRRVGRSVPLLVRLLSRSIYCWMSTTWPLVPAGMKMRLFFEVVSPRFLKHKRLPREAADRPPCSPPSPRHQGLVRRWLLVDVSGITEVDFFLLTSDPPPFHPLPGFAVCSSGLVFARWLFSTFLRASSCPWRLSFALCSSPQVVLAERPPISRLQLLLVSIALFPANLVPTSFGIVFF